LFIKVRCPVTIYHKTLPCAGSFRPFRARWLFGSFYRAVPYVHCSSQGGALVHCSSQGDALCYFFRPFRAVMGGID